MRTITLAVLLSLPLALSAADEPIFLGIWTVNPDLSAEVQPEAAGVRWWEGLGKFSANTNIGGIPVPIGGSAQPGSDNTPPNPDMLRCQVMKIARASASELLLTYVDVDKEKIRKGRYRGTHSQWSSKKLSSNYESTSRKVKRTLEVRKDGRLLMTVKLNPNKGKTRVFKRVFDRQSDT
ncbi:MAG: hypothetical protein QF921_12820 [Pseudomonadales bacterium]|jgi:hypothetical protein|nr:hypothetical protein [Pseudomonadales bacterium]MDP6471482.1 hypothetical protein [Pseudomonadales bacterium]MDP6828652.1 hypothetical protein [Pseudomonadales bacterium]MDP6972370.1 hypothetical protein [Pseudomonadales bacterium]|tara:strand:+ start:9923 stop:10459 length:537 start_codon:yes stop_codon:yes gene_type:complete